MPDRDSAIHCRDCGNDCLGNFFMCDQVDEPRCPECFGLTACAAGTHGEGCAEQERSRHD